MPTMHCIGLALMILLALSVAYLASSEVREATYLDTWHPTCLALRWRIGGSPTSSQLNWWIVARIERTRVLLL